MSVPTSVTQALSDAGLKPVENAPLAKRTWWQVGGPADVFVRVGTVAEIQAVLRACTSSGTPAFVLGNGTNLLISDAGIRGVVLQLSKSLARAELTDPDSGIVTAGGGTKLAALLQKAIRQGWVGLEVFAGIPGTVGGAIRMNAGAKLGETKDVLLDATIVLPDGSQSVMTLADLRMAYRHSELPTGSVVASARFRLRPGDVDTMRASVQSHLEHRATTQPLDLPSCGSTFRNPPGDHAGRLIEAAGLKGFRVGDAQVSEKHANFVVNLGAATAGDVRTVVEHMASTVKEQFGVTLVREVHLAGDWGDWSPSNAE